jgi:hypothetical protein
VGYHAMPILVATPSAHDAQFEHKPELDVANKAV